MAQSKPRQQVNPILQDRVRGAETPQPSASPTSRYFAPRLPQPVLDQILDLSPLSETLTRIAYDHSQTALRTETQRLIGEASDPTKLALAEPSEASKEFSRKLQSGELPPTASPWFHLTAKGVYGEKLMQLYALEMQKYEDLMVSVNDGMDPQFPGEVGGPKMTFEQAHAKVMEYLSESPAYADALVRGDFQQRLQAWSGQKRVELEGRFLDAKYQSTVEGLTENRAAYFLQQEEKGWPLGYQDELKAWDKQLRVDQPTLQDPRKVIIDGALSAAASLSSQHNNQAAYALLSRVAEVEIGGMALGDNPKFSDKLDVALDNYEREADLDGDRQLKQQQQDLEKARFEGRLEWLPILVDAEQAGQDPLGAISPMLDALQAKYGAYGAEVVKDAQDTAQQFRTRRSSDPDVLDNITEALVAENNPDKAELLLRASLGQLTASDGLNLSRGIEVARATRQNIDSNEQWRSAYSAVRESFDSAIYTQTVGATQAALKADIDDLIGTWERKVRAAAAQANTPGGREALESVIEMGRTEIIAQTRERAKEVQDKQQQAFAKLEEAVRTFKPLDDIFQEYAGYITPSVRENYEAKADEALNNFEERYLNTPEVSEFLNTISRVQLERSPDIGDELIDDIAARQYLFFDLYREKLGEVMTSADPRERFVKSKKALAESKKELMTLLGMPAEAISRVLAGEREKVLTKAQQARDNEVSATGLNSILGAGRLDEITGDSPAVFDEDQMAVLPETLRDDLAFGIRLRAEDPAGANRWIRSRVAWYITETLPSEKLTAPEKQKRAIAAIRLAGVGPDEFIAGEVRFTEPPPYMTFNYAWGGLGDPRLNVSRQTPGPRQDKITGSPFAQAELFKFKARFENEVLNLSALNDARAWVATQESKGRTGGAVAQVKNAILRAEGYMAPKVFKIGGSDLNPLTDLRFESLEQLQEWTQDPQRWSALKAAAGVGPTDKDEQDFLNFLRESIR